MRYRSHTGRGSRMRGAREHVHQSQQSNSFENMNIIGSLNRPGNFWWWASFASCPRCGDVRRTAAEASCRSHASGSGARGFDADSWGVERYGGDVGRADRYAGD
jgi:hypothetical protein